MRVSKIEMAGCYDALIEPVRVRNANYYAEFFRATGKIADVQKFYQKRAEHYTDFKLSLLVHRIGRLGPDPGGLAVWTLPNFASLEKIARELDDIDDPVRLETAGTYMDVGQEIL